MERERSQRGSPEEGTTDIERQPRPADGHHVHARAPQGPGGQVSTDSPGSVPAKRSRTATATTGAFGPGEAKQLERLRQEFGDRQVDDWRAEGMDVETMGDPSAMRAFRENQTSNRTVSGGPVKRSPAESGPLFQSESGPRRPTADVSREAGLGQGGLGQESDRELPPDLKDRDQSETDGLEDTLEDTGPPEGRESAYDWTVTSGGNLTWTESGEVSQLCFDRFGFVNTGHCAAYDIDGNITARTLTDHPEYAHQKVLEVTAEIDGRLEEPYPADILYTGPRTENTLSPGEIEAIKEHPDFEIKDWTHNITEQSAIYRKAWALTEGGEPFVTAPRGVNSRVSDGGVLFVKAAFDDDTSRKSNIRKQGGQWEVQTDGKIKYDINSVESKVAAGEIKPNIPPIATFIKSVVTATPGGPTDKRTQTVTATVVRGRESDERPQSRGEPDGETDSSARSGESRVFTSRSGDGDGGTLVAGTGTQRQRAVASNESGQSRNEQSVDLAQADGHTGPGQSGTRVATSDTLYRKPDTEGESRTDESDFAESIRGSDWRFRIHNVAQNDPDGLGGNAKRVELSGQGKKPIESVCHHRLGVAESNVCVELEYDWAITAEVVDDGSIARVQTRIDVTAFEPRRPPGPLGGVWPQALPEMGWWYRIANLKFGDDLGEGFEEWANHTPSVSVEEHSEWAIGENGEIAQIRGPEGTVRRRDGALEARARASTSQPDGTRRVRSDDGNRPEQRMVTMAGLNAAYRAKKAASRIFVLDLKYIGAARVWIRERPIGDTSVNTLGIEFVGTPESGDE